MCEGRVVRCWHTSTALNVVGDRNCRICIIAGGFEMQIMASISIITINRPSPDQELGIDDDLSQHRNVTRGATTSAVVGAGRVDKSVLSTSILIQIEASFHGWVSGRMPISSPHTPLHTPTNLCRIQCD